MQAAWEQVGDVLAAERAFSLARLVARRAEARSKRAISPSCRPNALAGGARAGARAHSRRRRRSLYGRIADATSAARALRRRDAPPHERAPVHVRMAQWRERNLAPASVDRQMVTLVDTFANASRNLQAIDPNRFVPDGLMGSVSFDKIPLPAEADAVIDLAPYTGLPGTMTAAEIRTIQQQNAQARAAGARIKATPPQIGDVLRQGLITETHVLRLAQLEKAAGRPLVGDVAQLIQQASQRGSEGVLLSVNEAGVLSAQALKVSIQTGTVTTSGSVLNTAGVRVAPIAPITHRTRCTRCTRRTEPPATARRGTAREQYSSSATTRCSRRCRRTRSARAAPYAIQTVRPGVFTGVTTGTQTPPASTTITVPPAIKDAAVLQRYAAAFKDYQQTSQAAVPGPISIAAVDFAIKPAAGRLARHRSLTQRAGTAGVRRCRSVRRASSGTDRRWAICSLQRGSISQ